MTFGRLCKRPGGLYCCQAMETGNSPGGPVNIITLVVLLVTTCLAGGVALALVNPGLLPAALGPLPLPPTAFFPTPTVTSRVPTLPPAWTSTPVPTSTRTSLPSKTPLPTLTFTPTNTRRPTATRTATARPNPSATPQPTNRPNPGGGPGPAPGPTATAVPAIPTIANPSFEGAATTDELGNQHPEGWGFFSPANGEALPYTPKNQEGTTVDAVSGGPGQYLLVTAGQIPSDEAAGQPRAIILSGSTTYKVTGPHAAHALRLSQTLKSTAGSKVRVTAYILGETYDQPSSQSGKLEDDHFIASVGLGDQLDKRQYAGMITHFDLPGNSRAWNKFVVEATFPTSGQLELNIIFQQNWPGNTIFFIDNPAVELIP